MSRSEYREFLIVTAMQAGIPFADARDTPVWYLERLAERVAPQAYRSGSIESG